MRCIIPEQLELSRELPVVVGNVDYEEFEWRLIEMDRLLKAGGLEEAFVERAVSRWLEDGRREAKDKGIRYQEPRTHDIRRWQRISRLALRCNLARLLTEKEYRRFTRRLAESPLLQWFCRIDRMECIRVPSKSTLERYDKIVPECDVRELVNRLSRQAIDGPMGLDEPLSLDTYLSDATCIKAAIHFPVDWVLLRDSVRTTMKAIQVIRRHGLKHRMPEPECFLRQINRLSIEMTHSRRSLDSRKRRKQVLRQMKRLNRLVLKHAQRYRDALAREWNQRTDLKEGQARQILRRLDQVMVQMPAAIRQAHERIIGERRVKNADKILSLYESDIHVVVRGKAGAEVEFGNTLWLGEQRDGLIIDWKLCKDRSPGDAKLFRMSLERIHKVFGRYPDSAAGDRGLWSQDNESWLESQGVYSALCPRGAAALTERMKDPRFVQQQMRRSQTEGRIGILKNDFLGRPLRNKGFAHRELAVAWAVLAHNLWRLTAIQWAAEKTKKKAA